VPNYDEALEVEPELITRLLEAQHPGLAGLPLGRRFHGWDNVIVRLGDDLAVRLPRTAAAVGSMVKELTWLPRLRSGWTFPAPVPVAAGEPGEGYPWPWSVVTWVHGSVHAELPWDASAAEPFATALRQVHVPLPADAEPPENLAESRSVAERNAEIRSRIADVAPLSGPGDARLDAVLAKDVWDAAGFADPPAVPVMLHADLHLLNVTSVNRGFGGITDWGDLCVGDPGVDLGRAAMLLPDATGFRLFLRAYGADDATEARARGLGLGAALRLAGLPASREVSPAAVASGWHGLRVLGVLQ
jgi:aminoglycoside phosphotransferase (APT) family kinase protein